MRPDTDNYRDIFLNDIPVMDTRAPIEFAKGAFPSSVSLPLMTDNEREQVGTCYKQKGQDEAIKLGHQLVQGQIKAERLKRWLAFAEQNPSGYLYCWRGGLRSQTVQSWMQDSGCAYPRVKGGYKAMRTWLLSQFEQLCTRLPMTVLAGKTGCNKTGLLNRLDNSIDLEGLANHLGSAFGKRPSGQPSQLNFENALAVKMLKAEQYLSTHPGQRMVFEDESLLIGRCSLPHMFRQALDASPVVLLEVDLEARIEHTYRNYILVKLFEWQQEVGEADAFQYFSDDLTRSLERVQKRLGGVRFKDISHQLTDALKQHAAGDPEHHKSWIASLLTEYYDPMYEYQLAKKQHRIAFRGLSDEVNEYLLSNRTASGK